jgi:hypothetical protein
MAHPTNGVWIRRIIVKLVLREIVLGANDARLGGAGQQGAGDHGEGEEVDGFHINIRVAPRVEFLVLFFIFNAAGYQRRGLFVGHQLDATFPTADAPGGKRVVSHPPSKLS